MRRKSLTFGIAIGAVLLAAVLPTGQATAAPHQATTVAMAADSLPSVTPAQVVARAQTWLTAYNGGPVPYDSGSLWGGYRQDCSGYVSMAFGFGQPGYVTSQLADPSISTPISKDTLSQGDLMINPGVGADGHVVIFDHWANAAHTSYYGYEQSGDGGTHYRAIDYPYFNGYPMSPYRYNNIVEPVTKHPRADFDGDGLTDQVLFRPSNGTWYTRESHNDQISTLAWGQSGDIPVVADFDGDGFADQALFRPSTGTWYIRYSSTLNTTSLQWGNPGDIPVVADYDGDGKADLALFRPSTGTWYVRESHNNQIATLTWGQNGDIPAVGDYDGDGLADQALYRPSTGTWYIRYSHDLSTTTLQWGNPGDIPVPADYDGDGITDIALFRPSTGTWYTRESHNGQVSTLTWGQNGDIPVVGDYDGDGLADQALFRPSTGTWYTRESHDLNTYTLQWGNNGDIPLS